MAQGYLPNALITPVKLKEILDEVRKTLQVTNPDYDLAIERLHPYYDMQLVTFGIDKDKNPLASFLDQEVHTSIKQNRFFVFKNHVLVLLCSP